MIGYKYYVGNIENSYIVNLLYMKERVKVAYLSIVNELWRV